ncbi:MAG: hypothetical protein K2H82_03470 [Oscillospiraceae bacterium]|nr:hypothetical protein [Oscillospiraceae bacterium]
MFLGLETKEVLNDNFWSKKSFACGLAVLTVRLRSSICQYDHTETREYFSAKQILILFCIVSMNYFHELYRTAVP